MEEFFVRDAAPASAKSQSRMLVAFICLLRSETMSSGAAVHIRPHQKSLGSHKFFCLDWFGGRNYAP